MSKVLYCKNNPVYNIDTEQIYNENLLPGYMLMHGANKYTFKIWLKLRYSSNTNTLARQLKGVAFGQGNRISINNETHALSLSDCYWIKDDTIQLVFESVSPYHAEFWKGIGEYTSGQSIPTLYVGGYLRKEWINRSTLLKYGQETQIEYEATNICKLCNIRSVNIQLTPNGIAVENITNINLMLEQADQSGRLDPDDFDEDTIENLFGVDGIRMLIIDAIIGNGDRHAGNFGWLRSTDTGKYICMAPLYDFDHALDSKSESDRIITDAARVIKAKREYIIEAQNIARKIVSTQGVRDIFKLRANTLYNNISKHMTTF